METRSIMGFTPHFQKIVMALATTTAINIQIIADTFRTGNSTGASPIFFKVVPVLQRHLLEHFHLEHV